jgi:uncharacterized Ntn-hydrolase superfamily protein
LHYRQIGLVRRDGTLHAHTGPKCRPWTGHQFAEGCVVMGNFLAGEHVLNAMASAFTTSAGQSLAERLLRALEAGRDAGGQADAAGRHHTERSAALKIIGGGGIPGIDDPAVAPLDIRVDMHHLAVDELRRHYSILQHVPRYNALRSSNPLETPGLADWEAREMTASPPPNPVALAD